MARAAGPLTTIIGLPNMVVQISPCRPNSSVSAASSAASSTGMYSGLQPASTALIATFSTVTGTRSGGISPTTSSGWRLVPLSMRSTRTGVGGTTGRPSLQPRSKQASIGSSALPMSISRDCRRISPKASSSSSLIPGSSVFEPQPGRITGSASPSSARPVSCRQSSLCQP